MSPVIARKVIQFFHEASEYPEPPPLKAPATRLTPREQEVLQRLAEGFLYKEIATALGLSVETVRTHVRNIYEKLHVRTRMEAVVKVYGRPKGMRNPR